MRVLANVVLKEVRELFTVQMFVPFIAGMVILVGVGRLIRTERARAQGPLRVIVANLDHTSLADSVVATIGRENLAVVTADAPVATLLAQAQAAGIYWVIVIPPGFSDSIAAFKPAEMPIYNVVRSFSVTQAIRGLEVKTVLANVNARIADDRLRRAYPAAEPEQVRSPVKPRQYVVVKGRTAEGNSDMLMTVVFSQTFMIPIILLMVLIYTSQMIASSIGQEKENKTLETLLTVPISRVTIVLGKMLGAAAVGLALSCVFIGAMAYYSGSFTAELPQAGAGARDIVGSLDIGLTVRSLLVMGVGLFLAVVCALSLSTLLAVFADDAKSAQVMVTPLMMLVMLPYFFSVFLDLETASLPVKVLVYAIPFSYPFLAPRAAIFGDYTAILPGYLYMAIFATVCVTVAAKIFSTDRILTAKLRWVRRSRERA
jgi:ABC-2 type transport system permease protein